MFVFFILIIAVSCSDSANILYVVPFTSKSHDIFLRPIGLELAKRGHNVTVITSFDVPNPPPNFHKVVIERKELWDLMGTKRPNIFDTIHLKTTDLISELLWKSGIALTEHILNSTQFQDFLAKDNKFDLVICEIFVQEATYALAVKYNAPLVLVTAFGNCMRHNVVVGNPLQLSTVLYEFAPTENPRSFLGRLKNLFVSSYEYLTWRYWYMKEQESLMKKYISGLPKDMPSLYDIQQNASLVLVNRHFSFNTPMAYLPNIVEIGGIHALANAENKSLPENLRNIMNHENGFVYVNFGTNLKSAELPVDKATALINVFGKINLTIFWKWEEGNPDMPENVFTREWFPQNEILAHPNIKLFIGHGGLMSTQEAVFHGVPLLGVPVYADQFNNMLLAEEAGFGKILNYHDINEDFVEKAINDMLHNDSYKIKAKEVSRRFKDRPMNPVDTAIFWIEYAIRNDGAMFMKSPGINMSWIAYNMLDIYLSLVIMLVIIIYVAVKMLLVLKKSLLNNEGKRKTL